MSKTAFLFPGQGSQSVGMLARFAEHQGIIDETLAQASQALGYSMADLIDHDPEDKLNTTEYTQPAILAASIAIHRILTEKNLRCDFVAGHSLGEYSALVAAGSMDFAQALVLVRTRGQLMQQAVGAGEGKMAAVIGADIAALEKLCAQVTEAGQLVQLANYNSRKQVVISGQAQAVESVVERIGEVGAKRSVMLPVGVPSHCDLMQPAADQLSQELDKIDLKEPNIPILPNVDPRPTTDPGHIRLCLVKQLSNSVQWVQTIETLVDLSVDDFHECGPGKVLMGLQRQIVSS